jgi:cyclase
VKVIGTDAWGLDRPFADMREAFQRDRDATKLWEAHRVGTEREYCQIEKLHNLGALPGATGFTVSCLPVKVAGASAGWCRAAAIVG